MSRGNFQHGYSPRKGRSFTYNSWHNMLFRCRNKTASNYPYYGGRGIVVCDRWLQFKNFLEDMGERPSKEYTLDRIEVNGNYCKENCKWATKKEQRANQRKIDKEDVGF